MTKTQKPFRLPFAVALMFFQILAQGGALARIRRVQDGHQWKKYWVRGEDFSISLPEDPSMTTWRDEVKPYVYRRIRSIGAYWNGVTYTIRTSQNVLKETADDLIKNLYKTDISEIESRRDLSLNGFQGRELVIKRQASHSIVQYWQTKKNLYVFTMMSRLDVPLDRSFFESLSFDEAPAGEEVREGIGAAVDSVAEESVSEIFSSKQVDKRLILASKPEPSYTENARMNQVKGTIVLKGVFSSKGRVINIHVVSGLPDGLTEKAVNAARQIKFIPAEKDGKRVSTSMQLEYNFNLY